MSGRPARALRALFVLALLPALAACGGLLPTPPERQLYRVAPSFAFPAGLPHAAVALAVATPSASAGLNTRRIALATSPVALDYFAGAEWADPAPLLVRDALVEGFQDSHTFAAVGPANLGTRADFVLAPAIRDFDAAYHAPKAPPRAEVTLDLRLVAMPQHQIVAARVVRGAAPAAANTVPAVVQAFSAALGQAVEKAVAWTAATPALSRRTATLESRFVHPDGAAKP